MSVGHGVCRLRAVAAGAQGLAQTVSARTLCLGWRAARTGTDAWRMGPEQATRDPAAALTRPGDRDRRIRVFFVFFLFALVFVLIFFCFLFFVFFCFFFFLFFLFFVFFFVLFFVFFVFFVFSLVVFLIFVLLLLLVVFLVFIVFLLFLCFVDLLGLGKGRSRIGAANLRVSDCAVYLRGQAIGSPALDVAGATGSSRAPFSCGRGTSVEP